MNIKEFVINWQEIANIWDDFVEDSPQGTVFAKTEFLNSLGVPFQIITVYFRHKIVAGTVILFSEDCKPLPAPFPFTPYQGLLLADNFAKTNHKRNCEEFFIVTWFVEKLIEKFDKISLAHSWQLQDIRPFQWYNYHTPEKGKFEVKLRYTGILKLTKFDSFNFYLSCIRAVRRQEMRKAIKNKLSIQVSDNIHILDKLHREVWARQGIEHIEKESYLLKAITEKSLAKGFGILKVCYLDTIPISAILFLFDRKRGYYMFAGNNSEYRESGGSTLLLLDLIEECFKRNLQEIDFVGVNSPNRGDYKLSFNPEIKPYFVTDFNRDLYLYK
ncbi:MAG: GNAT family N-acetyltransferase [Nostoc sp. DedQUE04]|uniref:GNAT family N-acetyltransferase n=1 Tax=Nostoc sp. DedQUE04 TaxID=3075390 RepID=UPI002AD22858|nr:GNAT family N-acetyltransferase [Nostoc sp. DedQUE04]MDZ8135049.1 GNAT family N-acetyltransferase [Nostoc sp. DedQUE04]